MINKFSNGVDVLAGKITDFLINNNLVKIEDCPKELKHPPLNGEIKKLEQLSDLLTEKELKYYGRICR
jgi:hypothetical protein